MLSLFTTPSRLSQPTGLRHPAHRLLFPCAGFVLAGIALAFGASAADYPTTVQGLSNLVGYWQFESATQANSSVNGYTGSFLGNAAAGAPGSGPPLAGISGNSALVLDGIGDAVSTNLATDQANGSAATIVAWIRLNRQPSTDPDHNVYQIAARADKGDDLDFQINPDNLLHFFTDSGTSVASPDVLPLHQWMMVAATFDVGNADPNQWTRALYIDGRRVASDKPGMHSANLAAFTIGYSAVWDNRFFNGDIDEVALYDRALSDSEIKSLQDASGDLIFRSNFSY